MGFTRSMLLSRLGHVATLIKNSEVMESLLFVLFLALATVFLGLNLFCGAVSFVCGGGGGNRLIHASVKHQE